jgi:3',5'-cyclic AMP phosphodiesterase CpdA
MANRRSFLKAGIAGAVVASFPSVTVLGASVPSELVKPLKGVKLRFAIASDGHYGQPDTPYQTDHENIVRWLNAAHDQHPLDFVIINGDLVHDRPDLLSEVKTKYYDRLKVPFYAIPGNHDHADGALWKSVFGYDDNYSIQQKGVGFVLANTADSKGAYLAPDQVFLKKELERLKQLEVVFVVLHIPPHLWVPENAFVDSKETVALLQSYPNVKAVFHGHDHSLDSVFYTGKLPHFFDAHIGGNWGTSYRGYRIVEVSEDHHVATYQVNASSQPVLNETKL